MPPAVHTTPVPRSSARACSALLTRSTKDCKLAVPGLEVWKDALEENDAAARRSALDACSIRTPAPHEEALDALGMDHVGVV